MTDRERWTIYPLLFLSLALSLRDKLLPPAVHDLSEVRCRRLEVVGADKQPRFEVGVTDKGFGLLQILNAQGKPGVVMTGGAGAAASPLIELVGADDEPRLVMSLAPNQSGNIEVRRGDAQPVIVLGAQGTGNAGAITTYADDMTPQVIISSVENNGLFGTVGAAKKKLVELTTDANGTGVLITYAGDNARQVVLDSQSGGRLTTFSPDGKPQFAVTHDDKGAGQAVAFDAEGNLYLPLTTRVKPKPAPAPESEPAEAKPAEDPAATEPPRAP